MMLSVFAIFPVLNLISLGYLMKASGEVVRTGRWRDGCLGFRAASRFGGILLGLWFSCWPIRFCIDLARDAALMRPDLRPPAIWNWVIPLGLVLTTGHILWALARGGKLRHFVWPAPYRFIRWVVHPTAYPLPAFAWRAWLQRVPVLSFLKLGFFGFLAAVIWLSLPVGIVFWAGQLEKDPGILVSLLGGGLLGVVAVYLPFLQTRYAADPNWKHLFKLGPVRQGFQRAPFSFVMALLVTLLFSIPLYLLKIELAPRELAWLPSLVFVVFIFPARIVCGWAMHRAQKKEHRAHFVWRWVGRLGIVGVGFAYGLFVLLTQFLSWHGTWSLLEQHAFMVPAPWLSL